MADQSPPSFSDGGSHDRCQRMDDTTALKEKIHLKSGLPNGCINHVIGENGLNDLSEKIDDMSIDCKEKPECPSPEKFISSDTGNDDNKEISKSQRNSTTDSGIYGSDADQTPNKVDVQSLADSVTECDLSCELDENSKVPEDTKPGSKDEEDGIHYVVYESEEQMPNIMRLITKDLSEPYSIYTYRYFIHNWPKLCFLAMCGSSCVGAIVCKLDLHKKMVRRGYIAMLAVDQNYRRRRIASHLVLKAIKAMVADDCDEVVLETEITNRAALHLYENLGFVRDKRLFRYYLNGVDALRLKLWLR